MLISDTSFQYVQTDLTKYVYAMLDIGIIASMSEYVTKQWCGKMTVITESKNYCKSSENALCKIKNVFWHDKNFCPVLSGIEQLSNITAANNCPSTQSCCYALSLLVAMETMSVKMYLNCSFLFVKEP